MSSFNEIDIHCEKCNEDYKGIVWTAVHSAQDPELRDILLGGELNLLMCPKCSTVAYQDHFVLYQDPSAELVAYIYPPAQQSEETFLRATMMASFKEAQELYGPRTKKDYDPILVFGLATFVDMMHAEEDRTEQSQIAQAICHKHNIPYTLLRPSEARKLITMRVIPGKTKNPEDVLEGIQQLRAINPKLNLYAQLAETLAAKPTLLKL